MPRTHRLVLQREHADLAVEEVGVGGHVEERPGGEGQVQTVADACGYGRCGGTWVGWVVGWLGDGPGARPILPSVHGPGRA